MKKRPRRTCYSGRCRQLRQLQHQYQVYSGSNMTSVTTFQYHWWQWGKLWHPEFKGRGSSSSPDRVHSVILGSRCSLAFLAIVYFPSLLLHPPYKFSELPNVLSINFSSVKISPNQFLLFATKNSDKMG